MTKRKRNITYGNSIKRSCPAYRVIVEYELILDCRNNKNLYINISKIKCL